jgi:hypothetical protein
MKQVLRESLWLLSGGQYLSLLDEREPISEVSLGYIHFSALRPEISASSWRGAMLKAQERGWVHKRLNSGSSTFQLTKTGREVVAADFSALRQFLGGKRAVSVLAFKAVQKISSAKAGEARSWLEEVGGVSLSPGLWVFPTSTVPDWLLTRLRKTGYLTLPLAAVQGGGGRSLDLSAWTQGKIINESLQTVRRLEETSRSIGEVLALLESEKKLHHLQISHIGAAVTSVLSEMKGLSWLDLENAGLLETLFRALQASDEVIVAWTARNS